MGFKLVNDEGNVVFNIPDAALVPPEPPLPPAREHAILQSFLDLLASKKFKVLVASCLAAIASGLYGHQPWNWVGAECCVAVVAWLVMQGTIDVEKIRNGK